MAVSATPVMGTSPIEWKILEGDKNRTKTQNITETRLIVITTHHLIRPSSRNTSNSDKTHHIIRETHYILKNYCVSHSDKKHITHSDKTHHSDKCHVVTKITSHSNKFICDLMWYIFVLIEHQGHTFSHIVMIKWECISGHGLMVQLSLNLKRLAASYSLSVLVCIF